MSALTRNTFLPHSIRCGTMLVLGALLMFSQQTALADSQCPAPALSVKESPITRVDEQNYSLAETQVIFADYVGKIAAAKGLLPLIALPVAAVVILRTRGHQAIAWLHHVLMLFDDSNAHSLQPLVLWRLMALHLRLSLRMRQVPGVCLRLQVLFMCRQRPAGLW